MAVEYPPKRRQINKPCDRAILDRPTPYSIPIIQQVYNRSTHNSWLRNLQSPDEKLQLASPTTHERLCHLKRFTLACVMNLYFIWIKPEQSQVIREVETACVDLFVEVWVCLCNIQPTELARHPRTTNIFVYQIMVYKRNCLSFQCILFT